MIRQNSKLPNLVKSFLVIIFKETSYEMKMSGKEIQHSFSKKKLSKTGRMDSVSRFYNRTNNVSNIYIWIIAHDIGSKK